MNILPDLNIIIDRLIDKRPGYLLAQQIFTMSEKKGYNLWVSASSVDNLYYILLNKAKKMNVDLNLVRIEFEAFIKGVKIFSVTGLSIRENLRETDLEDHIIYKNFKRIAPEGIVISKDGKFQKYTDVIAPEEFVKRFGDSTSPSIDRSTPKNIPLLDLQQEYRYMLEDIDDAILKSVAEAKYILGPQVKELEDKIAEYLDVKHCIGASSGTEALILSLRALAIKLKGQQYFDKTDEIITAPFTFTATGDAILRAGATPVFVDIDPVTYNIDPAKIREYLTRHSSHIVGIIPVHLYGQSCNMDEIMKIAKEYNLFVLEDVAQAFGGIWKGKKLGSIGTTGAFSFFPSKNLGGFGDGGMVSTNDDELAGLMRMLLKHGGKDKYNVEHIGYNARLDTLQAAILLAKFKYIDGFNERRRKIAEIYNRELAGIDGLVLPTTYSLQPNTNNCHVYHQYTIRVSNGKRDALQTHLKENGISAMVYYPVPLHKMKVFDGRCKISGSLKGSENAVAEVLSLPMEPLQNGKETKQIIDSIRNHFGK